MNVALLSDIHGNAVALESVIEEVNRESPDEIVCLGDIAQYGPDPVAAVERIQRLGCPVINGNTDEWLFTMDVPDEDYEDKPREVYDIGEWVANQLSAEHERFMKSFEETVEIELDDGVRLLCYHGSPRSPWEHVEVDAPEEQLDEIVDSTDATILAGGHTHDQMVRRHEDVTFVNAGSVGFPVEQDRNGAEYNPPWAEWALVTASDGSICVELRRTAIDVEEVRESARGSDMPHREVWIENWRRER